MAEHEVRAEVSGIVYQLAVGVGDEVAEDDPMLLLECMKMEIPVSAPASGRVTSIGVAAGETVEEGQIVAIIESQG